MTFQMKFVAVKGVGITFPGFGRTSVAWTQTDTLVQTTPIRINRVRNWSRATTVCITTQKMLWHSRPN